MSVTLTDHTTIAELTYHTYDLVFAVTLLAVFLALGIFRDAMVNLDRKLGAMDGTTDPNYNRNDVVNYL
jgi:hypothetical protein